MFIHNLPFRKIKGEGKIHINNIEYERYSVYINYEFVYIWKIIRNDSLDTLIYDDEIEYKLDKIFFREYKLKRILNEN